MYRLLTALPTRIAAAAGFFGAIAMGLANAGADAKALAPCAGSYHGLSWQAPGARDALGARGFERMAADAAGRRVVYFGETHERSDHIASLLELVCRMRARGMEVAIGVEFLQQPFQPYVDDYLDGRISEEALRRLADYDRRWGYDFEVYAPVLRYARDAGLPVVALNVPSELSRKVARGGFGSLGDAERALLPTGIETAPREYGSHLDAIFGADAHAGMSRENFLDALLLWDEGMAARTAEFVQANPQATLVVLAGVGHVGWPGGIPERVARRIGHPGLVVVNHDGTPPPLPPGSYALTPERRS